MSKLKPCPFCGGEAVIEKTPNTKTFRARCTKCPCDLGRYWYFSKAAAKKAWNERANEGEQK